MVKVRHVSKRYGDQWALRDVSLDVDKGTMTALIGPNGAGKSTLLSIVGRIIRPDGGTVWVDGKTVDTYGSMDLARKLTYLRQSTTVGVRLTVKDLVSFGRFPHCEGRLRKDDWEIVHRALAYMELEGLEDAFLDELSGGQRQRALIAMVLAQDTDYILLDEPLNNLDMRYGVQIMKLLQRMVKELGKTVLITLHDINMASIYADQIVALKDGCVWKRGSVETVIQREVLRSLFDIDMLVTSMEGRRICIYAQW